MAFRRLLCAAVAVNSLDESLPRYTEGLGLKLHRIHQGERGYGIRVAELGDGETPMLELIESPGDGPVRRFLEKHGEGLYQIRLETDGLYDTIKELEGRGVRTVMPQPKGGGERIAQPEEDITLAFVHPSSTSGVLIEMYPPEESGQWF
ncbi:MAG TPA: VOC family protein [Dehalococcoidia bacterium]|nr:VOC family protein [Dehalococcoidia bacterium]